MKHCWFWLYCFYKQDGNNLWIPKIDLDGLTLRVDSSSATQIIYHPTFCNGKAAWGSILKKKKKLQCGLTPWTVNGSNDFATVAYFLLIDAFNIRWLCCFRYCILYGQVLLYYTLKALTLENIYIGYILWLRWEISSSYFILIALWTS